MRILFFLFFTFTCLAQNNDQRLAYQYFVDGDYEKAIVLYEEINKKKFSINTYNPYYTSLINLNRFSSGYSANMLFAVPVELETTLSMPSIITS